MLRRLAFGLPHRLAYSRSQLQPLREPPTTVTTHEKGLVETFVDFIPTDPCAEEGPLYTITTTATS